MAEIILLVGPKGSGKTTIGRVLERERGVHFIEVERIAQRVLAGSGGTIDEDYAKRALEAIAAEVERVSAEHGLIVLETTGASQHTSWFVELLSSRYRLHLVRVRARAQTCADRIATRDSSRQVDVPRELVEAMHARTEALELPFDVEVDNDSPLAEARILQVFEPLLQSARAPHLD